MTIAYYEAPFRYFVSVFNLDYLGCGLFGLCVARLHVAIEFVTSRKLVLALLTSVLFWVLISNVLVHNGFGHIVVVTHWALDRPAHMLSFVVIV